MRYIALASALLISACHVSHPTFYNLGKKAESPDGKNQNIPASDADATPDVVDDAQPIGAPDPQEQLDMLVHVGLRNEDELDAYLTKTTDPNAPEYGQFLTREQFAAKYLATPEQMAAVRDAMQARGLHVQHQETGSALHVTGSVQEAEHAFNVRLRHYENPADHHTVRAPDRAIELPAGLGIVAVHGLATPPKRTPKHVVAPMPHGPRSSAWVPYRVKGIRLGYAVPDAATGKGGTVGLVQLDGYRPRDIASYASLNSIGLPKLTNVPLGGYDGHIIDSGSQMEVTMDIELAMAMSPQLSEVVVYQADQTANYHAWFDIWNEIANPSQGRPLVRTISCSWGTPERQTSASTRNSENIILKQMAAQGQTAFVASGDNGAYADGRYLGTDDPSSQRWAIAVGGTTLNVNNDGSYGSESTWSGGGGGLSSYWLGPAWQANAATSTNKASDRLRNVPDVSLNADPQTGYAILMNGYWSVIGGTSAAAPLWAGFWEAAQQARVAGGQPRLGHAGAILWGLGHQGVYHDVNDGSTNQYYHAVAGFDPATGWGSLNGAPLWRALTAPPAASAPKTKNRGSLVIAPAVAH